MKEEDAPSVEQVQRRDSECGYPEEVDLSLPGSRGARIDLQQLPPVLQALNENNTSAS